MFVKFNLWFAKGLHLFNINEITVKLKRGILSQGGFCRGDFVAGGFCRRSFICMYIFTVVWTELPALFVRSINFFPIFHENIFLQERTLAPKIHFLACQSRRQFFFCWDVSHFTWCGLTFYVKNLEFRTRRKRWYILLNIYYKKLLDVET